MATRTSRRDRPARGAVLVIVILFAFPGPRHLIVTSLEMAAAAAAGAFIAAMFFLPKKRS